MEQYSEEWYQARLGKVTASAVVDICKGVKGRYLAGRKNYMAEKIKELLTDIPPDNFVSTAMQWGTDTEPEARAVYEAETGLLVDEVGFIEHPTIDRLGASPDGMIDDKCCIEIKCPNSATHIELLLGDSIPRRYIYQMNCQMMCTGTDHCDFVSYDPRVKYNMSFYLKTIERDINICEEIETETKSFLKELDKTIADLKARYK